MEQLKDKKNIIGIAVIVVVALVSFYCGTLYSKNKPYALGGFEMADRQGFVGVGMRGDNTARSSRGMIGGMVAGEIITKDTASVTVKMQDGSTKIVLIGASTQVAKSTTGTTEDLAVGTNILVVGAPNTDGSVAAHSVQIRPIGTAVPVK